MADDGEKFGIWPGTYALCHEEKWLERFFEGLLSQEWIDVTTPGSVLDRLPSSGKVYLPTASYREMTEWALPVESGRALARVKARLEALPDGAELLRWVRGGHWRNFLVKYPEGNDLYCRMLRVSQDMARALAADPDDPVLAEARDELWRGQCNDAYWHGIFGGLYLPHLRRAVWQALLRAEAPLLERRLGEGSWREWEAADRDGDGQPELYVGTASLALTIHPDRGGSLSEFSVRSVPLNLLDTLTRRPEAYHDLKETSPHASPPERVTTIHESLPGKALGALRYDRYRRVSFVEAIVAASADLRAWERGEETALHDFAKARWQAEVKEEGERGLSVLLKPVDLSASPVEIEKTVSLEAGNRSVAFRYALRSRADLRATLTSQWNVALTAGDAPGRYFELPGRPSLAAEGETEGTKIVLVDEWIGLRVELVWQRPARIHYAPIHTLSLSEAGFEEIYQGTSLVVGWPLALRPEEIWQEALTLSTVGR